MGDDASVQTPFFSLVTGRARWADLCLPVALAGPKLFRADYESENSARVSAPAGEISRSMLARYDGVCLHPRIRLRGVGAAHTGPLIEEQLHGLTRQPGGASASRFRMRAAQSIGYVECQLSSAFHLVHSALRHGCFAILPGSTIT